jgi:hypothetical protein
VSGIKGMVASKPRQNGVRRKVWQSMRILRRFTIPDLCRTSGASVSNVRKFVRHLARHGYVARQGTYVSGRPGSYQGWRLVKNIGPEYPLRCEICGNPMSEVCRPKDHCDVETNGGKA